MGIGQGISRTLNKLSTLGAVHEMVRQGVLPSAAGADGGDGSLVDGGFSLDGVGHDGIMLWSVVLVLFVDVLFGLVTLAAGAVRCNGPITGGVL